MIIPGSVNTQKNLAVIKQALLQTSIIKAITRTSYPITDIWSKSPAPECDAKTEKLRIIFVNLNADDFFIKTLDGKLLEGLKAKTIR